MDEPRDGTAGDRMPLRIGYLVRMYPRFSQTFVVNEIRELERQGCDVAILSIRKPNEGIFHESVCQVRGRAYYVPANARGERARYLREQWGYFCRRPRAYRAMLRALRLDDQAEWFDAARATYLLRWARQQGIEHVHVHFGTNEATIALMAHLLGGLSYSMTLHAYDIFRNTVNRTLLRAKIDASRFTITVSESNRKYLLDTLHDVDSDKIRVNYNGVDLRRFRPDSVPREERTIFAVGRLKEKKGFIGLIRAVRRLRDEGVRVSCRIAGEGPDERKLNEAITNWNLSSHVRLIGAVHERQVRALMQRSACFVLPCVRAKDGNIDALPTVLLESLACGCPTISTRLSGVPEILEDGVSGLLVDPEDDKALAGAIRRVFDEPELAASLSRGGRRRAEQHFDIRRNVAVMHRWLRSTVAARTEREREADPALPPNRVEPQHEPQNVAVT